MLPTVSYEPVLDSIVDGIFLVNENGEVYYCNQRAAELTGASLEKVIGASHEQLFEEISTLSNQADRTFSELQDALDALPHQTTVHIILSYPLVYHLCIKLFVLKDHGSDGDYGWGGTIQDMTEEWEEIKKQSDHLSSLANQLHAPVAGIKGFITTFISNYAYWDEGLRQDFLQNLSKSAEQLSSLLENMQVISKLEVNALQLDFKATSLKQVAEHSAKRFMAVTDHAFQVDIDPEIPNLPIDRLRIEQVFHAILDNGIKWSPPDKRIIIAAELQDDEVLVMVEDQGVGIPADHIDFIFDMFYQVNYGQSGMTKGAGLGLYVAHGLVTAHGGRIWADSIPGQRTRIYFTLPLEAHQQSTVRLPNKMRQLPQRAAERPQMEAGSHNSMYKVMIVEDDPQIMRLLKVQLEGEGYKVIMASFGKTALELAVTESPDLILLDIKLPDFNGIDVCERLREFTNVPIIIVTAGSTEENIERGLDVGADDFLSKPFSNKELMARIRANLRRFQYQPGVQEDPVFSTGGLVIDYAQRQVHVDDEVVKLTSTEYKILSYLAMNAGRIITYDQLLNKVWGPYTDQEKNYLWTNVSRIRKKIEPDPKNPRYLMTEPGVGYFLSNES